MKTIIAVLSLLLFATPVLADRDGHGGGGGEHHGWGGVHGAPGPIAGAGLPILAIGYGVYWLVKRRRNQP
jgi:hypothetical protein